MAEQDTLLIEAEKHVQELYKVAKQKQQSYKEYQEYYSKLDSDVSELTLILKQLERECSELEVQTTELDKKTSSSRDARKMYGDVTPGDTTHQDVILLYLNYFKTTFRSLPKELPNEEKYVLWQMTAKIVKESFEQNKEAIIAKMMTELVTALTSVHTDQKDENVQDLYRAFNVFVNEKKKEGKLKDIEKEVLQKLLSQNWDRNTAIKYIKLTTDIITQLDPEDYNSFIKEGKKCSKEGLVSKTISSASASLPQDVVKTKRKKVCAVCKKGSEIGILDKHLGQYLHRHCI